MSSCYFCICFFFKQKTAYEMRISDRSSDVCSSDLARGHTQTECAVPPSWRNGRPLRRRHCDQDRRKRTHGPAGILKPIVRPTTCNLVCCLEANGETCLNRDRHKTL